MKMIFKCCCFGTKVAPMSNDIMSLSLCDSKNNNFVEKVITNVPESSKPEQSCLGCCFWRKTKTDIPFASSWDKRSQSDERENGLKPVLARQSKYPVFSNRATHSPVPPQPARFVSPIPSPITPLAPATNSQPLQVEDLSGDNTSEEIRSWPSPGHMPADPGGADQVDTLSVQEERLSTPPPLETPPPHPTTLIMKVEAESDTQLEKPTVEPTTTEQGQNIEQNKFGKNAGNPRIRGKTNVRDLTGNAPDTSEVLPFDNPKDALNKCIQQLEHSEWEVTIQGLHSLVRLCFHHSALLPTVLHQIMMSLTKHVRNLRSQVARVACKAAMHLFGFLGRGMENEMDELCVVLFNRTADTNKFLRADCNKALDAMVDSVSVHKSVSSIINKGTKHQNAVVRAAACRLLLRLCTRLGPERTLNLPRDTRDAILNTGARCLTEGSLDTRRYAKEMFILLGRDQRLTALLMEVVPTSVMRSISKVLARLTTK